MDEETTQATVGEQDEEYDIHNHEHDNIKADEDLSLLRKSIQSEYWMYF